ncbi:unnamed protein product [Soboliphyme baturini]|uniref:Chloride channel CLIC-like protein 1 n=1 Tax=Soboliphyme baturini TaxID=241478 RepID=A0A183ITG6_9BILA|nr:unnamed protein product [Soboliphyme baturini]
MVSKEVELFTIVTFLLLANLVTLRANDDSAVDAASKEHWIDPNDMVNFDLSKEPVRSKSVDSDSVATNELEVLLLQHQLTTCQQMLKHAQEARLKEKADADLKVSPESILMQHFLRKLLKNLDAQEGLKDPRVYSIATKVTPAQVASWKKFVTAKTVRASDWQEVIGSLIRFLHSAKFNDYHRIGVSKVLADFLLPWLPVFNVIALIIFFWTWYYLYQVKQAELLSRMSTLDRASACQPEAVTSFASFANRIKSMLGFRGDTCSQYFKDLTINPIWQVRPLQILSLTITEFFVEPAELVGIHLGRFFNALMSETTIFMKPIVAILAVLLLVVIVTILMVFLCGYRVQFCSSDGDLLNG